MLNIPILLGTTRIGRESEKVAKFVLSTLGQREDITTELLDLKEYDFPLLTERLRFNDNPPAGLVEFSDKIRAANGLIIVTPEYNNGYPAALKNALDYLLSEFFKKPIGIVSVSNGGFGGIYALAQLRLVLLGMGALPLPVKFTVSKVQENYDSDGEPKEKEGEEKKMNKFLDGVIWYTTAITEMKNREES